MSIFYINGEFVDEAAAQIAANDLSVLRGYGVFDFLRTYNGQPFRLHKNTARLRNSANLIGLNCGWTDEALYDIVMQTLGRNDHAESNIRIVITGGTSPDNITPTGESSLMVMVTPLHKLPAWWYTDGVKVITYPHERFVPGAKSTNYIGAIMSLRQARAQDAIESLYVNQQGHVTEGTTTNVFAFYGDKVVTPDAQILPGITRGTVLMLAEGEFEIELRPLPREELLQADEVMITAANKQVVPVIQIDDSVIGSGKVGARVQRIMALFANETQKVVTGV